MPPGTPELLAHPRDNALDLVVAIETVDCL
jgi:hypothetical protein